eukprot:scaffold302047_cov17-Tisochrysis_lutea.AAC.1
MKGWGGREVNTLNPATFPYSKRTCTSTVPTYRRTSPLASASAASRPISASNSGSRAMYSSLEFKPRNA